MQLKSILSLLLLASAVSLTVGGYLLYVNSLVPMILVVTTIIAVIILYIMSYFVARGNMIAINVSTVLGVIAPIMSASTPAHIGVLEQIATGGLFSFLGLLQLFGFYIFPIAFVILRIVFRSKLNSWL
ncbi:MAG: hypothetical protein ACYCPP_08745 [Nitrososphaerales archaeon]